MKKFGFGKKSADKDDDHSSTRSSLFGSRSSKKSGSPAPAAPGNPYAVPQSGNPYARAQNAPPGPEAYDSNKYAHMGGAVAAAGGGGGGGYGAPGGGSRYGPAGYGGLGREKSDGMGAADPDKDALFGGARDRVQQRAQTQQTGGPADAGYGGSDGSGAQPGGYGGGGYGSYGADRQLTAEEEEEEDVQAAKQQIRGMKQQDVASTRNALRMAAQAEETGRDTLTRLAAQGERIHNTEKNLDLANNQSRVAKERAKELKTLNKSMFAVHVSNPFTSGERRRERDDDVLNKHRSEREQREASRAAAFQSKARVDGAFKGLQQGAGGASRNKASLAERANYQFEADSEDDAMEDEIDSNLDALGGAVGRLNVLTRATGREVDEQNAHIDRIISKVSGEAVVVGWP